MNPPKTKGIVTFYSQDNRYFQKQMLIVEQINYMEEINQWIINRLE